MKIAAFCLCWLLILTAPGVMAQQTITPNQSWDALRQLQAREKLEVERKTGEKKVSGKFVSFSDTALIIERKRKNLSFSRDEVKNIYHVGPPSGKKRAIFTTIGGAVGFFLGFFAGLGIADSVTDDLGEAYAVLGGIVVGGALGGALAGYAMARSGQRTLIYSAP